MLSGLFGSGDGGSLLDRLKQGIEKTRTGLKEKLDDVIQGKKEIDTDVLDELEYALITADIGVRTVTEVLETIRQRVDRHLVGDAGELKYREALGCRTIARNSLAFFFYLSDYFIEFFCLGVEFLGLRIIFLLIENIARERVDTG